MSLLVILFIFFTPYFVVAQTQKLETLFKLDGVPLKENELRVYSTSSFNMITKLFRFYKEDNEWYAENYTDLQTYPKKPMTKQIIELKESPELAWLTILDSDILYLAQWDDIRYKLQDKSGTYMFSRGKWYSPASRWAVLDGGSYIVQISDNNKKNEIKYPNPQRYLELYPNVDELISINQLIDIVEKHTKNDTDN